MEQSNPRAILKQLEEMIVRERKERVNRVYNAFKKQRINFWNKLFNFN